MLQTFSDSCICAQLLKDSDILLSTVLLSLSSLPILLLLLVLWLESVETFGLQLELGVVWCGKLREACWNSYICGMG